MSSEIELQAFAVTKSNVTIMIDDLPKILHDKLEPLMTGLCVAISGTVEMGDWEQFGKALIRYEKSRQRRVRRFIAKLEKMGK